MIQETSNGMGQKMSFINGKQTFTQIQIET